MWCGARSFIAVTVLALALGLIGARAASGQVKLEQPRPPEETRLKVTAPSLHFEVTRPRDVDVIPRHPGVYYDPAFIEPFVMTWGTKRSTGQFGLSGWTSPNPPLGSYGAAGYSEVNGWLNF